MQTTYEYERTCYLKNPPLTVVHIPTVSHLFYTLKEYSHKGYTCASIIFPLVNLFSPVSDPKILLSMPC